MTDEQIKQKAEEYADALYDRKYQNDLWRENCGAHIAGAHSRDEEVEDLEQALSFAEDVVDIQRKELDKLRNPWINASKQLPPEDKEGSNISIDCLVMAGDGNSFFYVIAWYDYSGKCWYEKYDFDQTHIDGNKVFYWMERPKCTIKVEGGDK